jgi:hypothetical protein
MPAIVRKMRKGWVVLAHRGKGARLLGMHTTRGQALAQQRAVNANLRRRKKRRQG